MRTTRRKLNTRIYYANEAVRNIGKVISDYLAGYEAEKKVNERLTCAYQNLEKSKFGICENKNYRLKTQKIRSRQKLISQLLLINYYIGEYCIELSTVKPNPYTYKFNIDRDFGSYYFYAGFDILKEILKEGTRNENIPN